MVKENFIYKIIIDVMGHNLRETDKPEFKVKI